MDSKNLLGTFKGEPSSASFKLDPPPSGKHSPYNYVLLGSMQRVSS